MVHHLTDVVAHVTDGTVTLPDGRRLAFAPPTMLFKHGQRLAWSAPLLLGEDAAGAPRASPTWRLSARLTQADEVVDARRVEADWP